jgi:hypothetical protein
VAGDVLGQRLDLDVDAVVERPEAERRGPRVVEHHEGAAGAGGSRDRGDVLDLERLRPRRLEVDDPRVRAHQAGDGRPRARIVERDLDAVAREDLGAEDARRPVGRVRDEEVVVPAEKRGEPLGHGGEPRREEERAGAARQLRQSLRERHGRRGTVDAVGEGRVPALVAALVGGHRRIENRGGAIERRVDDPLLTLRVPAGMNQPRFPLHALSF